MCLDPRETPQERQRREKRQAHEDRHNRKIAAQLDKIVNKRITNGFYYSIDVDANQARIDPDLWSMLIVERKQEEVMFLSRYFDLKGSTGRVTILSNRNDQKLATYSGWSGVKILQ